MAGALARAIMELSSVSETERAEIMANFEIGSKKRYQCESCVRSITPPQRLKKGCEGCLPGRNFGLALNGKLEYEVTTCLGNLWNPAVFQWMEAYSQFKQGILPFAGALQDQPAKVMDIFQLLGALEAERAEEENKKVTKRGPRGG